MRIRDKRLEGGLTAFEQQRRNRKNKRHFAGYTRLTGEFAAEHENNVRFHRSRIVEEEQFLRENGINPLADGSAYEFDRLVAKTIVSI